MDRTFKIKDQVVVRRRNGRNPSTPEVLVADILFFSNDGKKATVSIPLQGGSSTRMEVNIENLLSVRDVYGRARVQSNSANRQVGNPA